MSEQNNKVGLPNLESLSRDELLDLLDKLDRDLQNINLQINAAKAKVRSEGVYADSKWWYKVNSARIIVTGYKTKVERELSKRKEERTAESLGDFFLQAARFHLKDDTFNFIMADARARMEDAGK